jgi:hypothetical protein
VARSVSIDKDRIYVQFEIDAAAPKSELTCGWSRSADALTSGEPDPIANMANIAAAALGIFAGCELDRVLPRG